MVDDKNSLLDPSLVPIVARCPGATIQNQVEDIAVSTAVLWPACQVGVSSQNDRFVRDQEWRGALQELCNGATDQGV